MKIAIGLIGIFISIIVLLQSTMLFGLGGLADEQALTEVAAAGVLTGFNIFLGGAFAFGLPRVSGVMFLLAFWLSKNASDDFPDLVVWGWAALFLGVLTLFTIKRKPKNIEKAKSLPDEQFRFASEDEEKECPDCAEFVKYEARKCRYCGYLFDSK